MRDEDGHAVRRLIGPLVFLLLLPVDVVASETTMTGEMTGRYSSFETFILTARPDGSFTRTRQSISYWSQDYRAGYGAQLRAQTNLYAELRYSDVSFVDGSQRTSTPSGLLRLTAPIYGLTASYRPTRRTNQVTTIDTGGDTTGRFTRTEQLSRNSDLTLSAYLAPTHLPRLDGQWIERHQVASSNNPSGTGTQRSLRAVQDLGHLMLQAGYNDQLSSSGNFQRLLRRSWSAGASYGLLFSGRNPVSFDYGFQRGENPGREGLSRNDSHNLNTGAAYRISRRASLDGGGFYRFATIQDGVHAVVRDYDFYAYHHYLFSPVTASRIGGGQRSFRDLAGVHAAPYLLATVTSEGLPRPRWHARAGAAHSTNWLGTGAPSTSDAVNLGSTFDVSRTFNAHVDLQSGARLGALQTTTGRFATTASGGLGMVPLRSISITVDASLQSYGPSPFVPTSRSSTESASFQWRPSPTVNLTVQRSVSGAFPNNFPRQGTTTLTAGWHASRLLQLDGNYARSDGTALTALEGSTGSESYGLRMISHLTRRLLSSLGVQQSNRGRPSETRYFDVAASYRFDL